MKQPQFTSSRGLYIFRYVDIYVLARALSPYITPHPWERICQYAIKYPDSPAADDRRKVMQAVESVLSAAKRHTGDYDPGAVESIFSTLSFYADPENYSSGAVEEDGGELADKLLSTISAVFNPTGERNLEEILHDSDEQAKPR